MSNLKVVRDGMRIGKFIVREWLSGRGGAQQALKTKTVTGAARETALQERSLVGAPSIEAASEIS
jgi:hypothetical protein